MSIDIFSNSIASPIISSFGTFCKLATDAFREVLQYLIRNMEVFKNIEEIEFDTLMRWIETNLADFLVKSEKLFAIEVWRIEEKIEKAKTDLKSNKSSISKLPLKKSYKKAEILDFVQKSMQPMKLDLNVFELHYAIKTDKSIYKRNDTFTILNTCFEHKIMHSLHDLRVAYDQQIGNRKFFGDLQKMVKKMGRDNKREEVVKKVEDIANYTLAHFGIGETQPISKFEKLLETPNFREKFDENSWNYLKNVIFKDLEKTKRLMKHLEHLYEFEEKTGKLWFSKREKYIGDSETIRLMEMEEMQRISDKMRDENSKLKCILDAIQGQLKDERKSFQEELQKLRKENQKEQIHNLKNELDLVKTSKIEIEKTLKKKENELVSVEKVKRNLENQLKAANKEKSMIEEKLEKMEKDLASVEILNKNLENQLKSAENKNRTIENQLILAETSRKSVEDELRKEKSSNIESQNHIKTVENELNLARSKIENHRVPETSKVNKKPREKGLKKIRNLETWFENGIDKMRRISENQACSFRRRTPAFAFLN